MKKRGSLLFIFLLSSALLWDAPAQAQALPGGKARGVPAETTAYCHGKFPDMDEDSLSAAYPGWNDGLVHAVDRYASCDYDPLGLDDIKTRPLTIFGRLYGGAE